MSILQNVRESRVLVLPLSETYSYRMIFPVGDDQVKGGSYPFLSYGFIGLNVLVFCYQLSLSPTELNQFVYTFGVLPNEISQGEDLFTLFSSMFMHAGWMHLLGNMLFLWVFADNIEQTVGNALFLLFYFLGGIAAALAHTLVDPGSTIPTVGASGAISAVLGAYLVMFPSSRVKILILIFFSTIRIPAFVFLGFWIGQQLISGFATLGPSSSGGVAWWAHIGGFVFGIIFGSFARGMIKRKGADRYDREEWS